jgi:hypothetical protein
MLFLIAEQFQRQLLVQVTDERFKTHDRLGGRLALNLACIDGLPVGVQIMAV